MLKISKLADYAVVVMHELALAYDSRDCQSASHIAQVTHLPLPTVQKVLKQLHHSDIVESIRGTDGGYRLCKSPDEISVADVIQIIDGPIAMTACSHDPGATDCDALASCRVRQNWGVINANITKMLHQINILDMGKKPTNTPESNQIPVEFITEQLS